LLCIECDERQVYDSYIDQVHIRELVDQAYAFTMKLKAYDNVTKLRAANAFDFVTRVILDDAFISEEARRLLCTQIIESVLDILLTLYQKYRTDRISYCRRAYNEFNGRLLRARETLKTKKLLYYQTDFGMSVNVFDWNTSEVDEEFFNFIVYEHADYTSVRRIIDSITDNVASFIKDDPNVPMSITFGVPSESIYLEIIAEGKQFDVLAEKKLRCELIRTFAEFKSFKTEEDVDVRKEVFQEYIQVYSEVVNELRRQGNVKQNEVKVCMQR